VASEPPTLAGLTAEALRRCPPVESVDLAFVDCSVRVLSNSQPVIEGLRRYYAPYVAAFARPTITITALDAPPPAIDRPFAPYEREEPGKSLKEEFVDLSDGRVVRKVRTGMVFAFNETDHLAVGDCTANLNQLVNFINSRYADWRLARGGLLLHGAGVTCHGAGVGIVGRAGMGKSTMALRLVDHGCNFLSNDRLIVEEDGGGPIVYGLPKQPRVNPGTLMGGERLADILPSRRRRELEALSPDQLWSLEEKYDVDIAGLYGRDRLHQSAPLSLIVVLNWRRGLDDWIVRPVDLSDRRDLLPMFMKSPGLFGYACGRAGRAQIDEREYQSVLRSRPTLEICGGLDFERAAHSIPQLLIDHPV